MNDTTQQPVRCEADHDTGQPHALADDCLHPHFVERPEPTTASGAELQQKRGRQALRRQEQVRRRGAMERAVQALPPGRQTLC